MTARIAFRTVTSAFHSHRTQNTAFLLFLCGATTATFNRERRLLSCGILTYGATRLSVMSGSVCEDITGNPDRDSHKGFL